jgi:CMP-N-acetylneuraminic acid synthetase
MATDQSHHVMATICARGGSKGVPCKNVRHLFGKPLIAYAIETARACPTIGHIVISTDSDEIATVAENYGVRVNFRRPAEMASDSAPKIYAIRHATAYAEEHEGFKPEIVVDLGVDVPLRAPEDITACVNVLQLQPALDASVTVYEAERNPYYTMVEFEGDQIHLVKPGLQIVARQAAPLVYSVSGSVFAWRRSSLEEVTHLYEGRWGACIVPAERAIDIDREIDFQFVEYLMMKRKREN